MRGVRQDFVLHDTPALSHPVRQGADFWFAFQLLDAEATETTPARFTDLTGLEFRAHYRAGDVDGPLEAEASFTTFTDALGEPWVLMHVPSDDPDRATDTRRMTAPHGVYDIEVRDGAEVRELYYGTYDLAREATRPE